MTNSDMFEDTKQDDTGKTTPVAQNNDPFADKLKAIVNEQGQPKYDSVEKALEALNASQQFIETLKNEKSGVSAELQKAREELAKMGSIEDFVKKLEPAMKTDEPKATTEVPTGLSEEAIKKLLQQQLEERDQQSQQQKNLDTVINSLSDKHGDKAAEFIRKRANELNTTPEQLKMLAKTNPALVMQALGGDKASNTSPSQSSLNMDTKPRNDLQMPTWEKGSTRGGLTDRQLADRFREAKAYTNKRLGLE